jgi:hypothetical protein
MFATSSFPRLLVFLLAFPVGHANAQLTASVPVDVETIVTGGKWSAGGQSGIYRIVVRTGGFEHIVSQAQVDWIATSTDRDKPDQVVVSKIAETGSWRLLKPRITQASGQWRAVLDGVETHFNPAPRGTWDIVLGPPGVLKTSLRRR